MLTKRKNDVIASEIFPPAKIFYLIHQKVSTHTHRLNRILI